MQPLDPSDNRYRLLALVSDEEYEEWRSWPFQDQGGLRIYTDLDSLLSQLDSGVGTLVLSDTIAVDPKRELLTQWLAQQPPWSDLPIVFLYRSTLAPETMEALRTSLGNVTMLALPVKVPNLVSIVRSQLRARAHQYDVQKILAQEQAARQAARQAEERFRIALSSTNVYVYTQDTDFRYTWVSNTLPGFSPEEVVGRLGSELVEEGWDQLVELRRSVLLSGKGHRKEVTLKTRGREIVLHLYVEPQFDDQGKITGLISAAVDVTAQKKVEEALRESEARFRILADALPQIVWTANPDGNVDFYNQRWAEFSGISTTGGHGWGWMPVLHPDDEAATVQAWSQAVQSGGIYQIEHRIRRYDGVFRWYLSRGIPLRDAKGNIIKWFGSATDIDDQKRTEQELRRNQEMLAEAQRIARLAHWEVDLATTRAFWSDMMWEITGLDPATSDSVLIHGNAIDQIIHPEDRALAQSTFEQCVGFGNPFSIRLRVVRPDGSLRHTAAQGHLVRDAEGNPSRLVGTMQDITETVRAEEQQRALEVRVQRSQKLESLGILAGGIAHDFNNLLVAVIGNADLALMQLPPESPVIECIHGIKTAGIRASELTHQMLAYSGRGRFVIEPVAVNQLIEEMGRLLQSSISKKAELRLELAPDLPTIDADPTQLRQVVMNLITNASEAMGERYGTITIRTSIVQQKGPGHATVEGEELPEGDYVLLEVADTGCGMDDLTRGRIFDPFFTTKFTGRGLGLAVVQGIVRGHKGAIQVQSQPGQGTVFRILFPGGHVQPRPLTVPPASRAVAIAPSHQAVILVVDDEELVRQVTSTALQRKGYQVLTAANGQEGVMLLKQHLDKVTAVLLDLTMPVMDGQDTFRAMRRIRPDLPVLLTSGFSEQEATARFAGLGLAGFISKPFTISELTRKLAAIVASTAHLSRSSTQSN